MLLSDWASYETDKFKVRPVSGCWLYLENDAGEYLRYLSRRAPLFSVPCLPFGKLRLGQSIEETLDRILTKRGVDPNDVVVLSRTAKNVRYLDANDKLIAHRFGVVVKCMYIGVSFIGTKTPNGEASFVSKDTHFVEVQLLKSKDVDTTIHP